MRLEELSSDGFLNWHGDAVRGYLPLFPCVRGWDGDWPDGAWGLAELTQLVADLDDPDGTMPQEVTTDGEPSVIVPTRLAGAMEAFNYRMIDSVARAEHHEGAAVAQALRFEGDLGEFIALMEQAGNAQPELVKVCTQIRGWFVENAAAPAAVPRRQRRPGQPQRQQPQEGEPERPFVHLDFAGDRATGQVPVLSVADAGDHPGDSPEVRQAAESFNQTVASLRQEAERAGIWLFDGLADGAKKVQSAARTVIERDSGARSGAAAAGHGVLNWVDSTLRATQVERHLRCVAALEVTADGAVVTAGIYEQGWTALERRLREAGLRTVPKRIGQVIDDVVTRQQPGTFRGMGYTGTVRYEPAQRRVLVEVEVRAGTCQQLADLALGAMTEGGDTAYYLQAGELILASEDNTFSRYDADAVILARMLAHRRHQHAVLPLPNLWQQYGTIRRIGKHRPHRDVFEVTVQGHEVGADFVVLRNRLKELLNRNSVRV